jgi:hypothetical protein
MCIVLQAPVIDSAPSEHCITTISWHCNTAATANTPGAWLVGATKHVMQVAVTCNGFEVRSHTLTPTAATGEENLTASGQVISPAFPS